MEFKELQRCRLNFYRLLSEHSIPPKMQIKLKYLQAAILGTKLQTQHLNQLPEIERSSLLQMPIDTKTTLYCNILRCLSGEEVISYFTAQKATLRREQFFSGWTSCYLDCDSNRLAVLKKKDKKQSWHQFLIQKLWISKVYRLYKKKYIFGISYEKVKYQIGFEEESSCQKVHGTIIDLIREKKAKRNKLKQSMSMSASVDGSQIQQLEFEKDEIIVEHEFNQADYFQYQEWEYLSNLQRKVKEVDLTDDSGYQLIKNIKKGKMMQNSKLNSLKICMLIEKCSIEGLIQSYVQLNAWNSQVQSFTILNRMRNNTFLAYLKLKKHSVFAYPRDAYVTISYMKACQCLNNYETEIAQPESIQCNNNEFRKHYLLINSLEDNAYEANSGAVRIVLNQIVQFSQVEDSQSTVFMILLSKIDFRGYQYLSNNINLNVNLMNDIESLPKYSIQRGLVGINNNIFNFNYCLCYRKKSRKGSADSQVSMESNRSDEISPKIVEEDKNISPSFNKEPGRTSFEVSAFQVQRQIQEEQSVVKIITDSLNSIRNQKMIDLIKQKTFQSYYLQHRFSQQVIDAVFKESNYSHGIIKDFLFQNGLWKIDHHELVFCNQEILKMQKSILKMIIKQMGSNLLSGKSIMNMSLPVEIFDKRSMLQVLASMMGFFPKFINDAINTTNPVEQIKFVTLSYMFVNACLPNLEKPFNPILGQTFQATIGGIPIYLEQISHHPAISSLYMKTKDFQTYGNFDIHVELGLNSAYSKLSSLFTVKIFKTKTEYSIKMPDVELGGVMFGDRTMRLVGKGFVYEKTNDMYCEYSLGKQKRKVYEYNMKIRPIDIAGGIFKVSNSFGQRLLMMNHGKSFDGVKFDDIIQKYNQLSGRWYGDLYFDNVAYKTIDKGPFPVKIQRSPYLLPSDSIFREDITFKGWDQIQQSNRQKQVLENLQRRDKKRRQQFRKQRQ